jgi:tetratricopeptide (TPR) repeat protein
MRFFPTLPILLAVALAGCQKPRPVDPRLQSPAALAQDAAGRHLHKIFVNPEARALFPGLPLAPASPRDAAAGQSPSLWRQLDRAQRFDAVLLAGQAGDYLALARHLAESPDFRLARVDNWGLLFVRGLPAPYTPTTADAEKFSTPDARGIYLSQMALRLDAAGLVTAARDDMAAALAAAPNEPSVHTRAAALALSRKRYAEALQETDRALALAPHDLAALEVKARTLSAAGAADQAWSVACELKDRAGDRDMNVLFLHARLSNAAHAYEAEQHSLERLIELAGRLGLPAADYRVYLGQCYAKQGLARPALEQLELALKDPNLTAEQRANVTTALETVRSRAGSL